MIILYVWLKKQLRYRKREVKCCNLKLAHKEKVLSEMNVLFICLGLNKSSAYIREKKREWGLYAHTEIERKVR